MATSVNALHIRRVLGRGNWSTPEPFGPDGWSMVELNGDASVIVSVSDHGDDEWIHASIARPDRMPSYDDLKLLHAAVFGDGWAYQVFAPPSDHVNIHKHALHLWGRLDGAAVLARGHGGRSAARCSRSAVAGGWSRSRWRSRRRSA